MRIIEKLKQTKVAVVVAADYAKERIAEHVRLEGPRTLFLSDRVITSAIRTLGDAVAPEAELRAEAEGPGYRVTGKVDEKSVSALVAFRSIRFEHGTLAVEVETRDGVDLAARPVANFFVGVVARLFGGMWLGEKLLSAVLPEGISWDGRVVRFRVNIENVGVAAKRLVSLEAAASVQRAPDGVLVELENENATSQVKAALVEVVWDLLREKLSRWLPQSK